MHKTLTRFLLLLLFAGGLTGQVRAQDVITTARYVDATGGDDAQDGTTPETAWKTLEKVNDATFGPGGTILFKAGESWEGRLLPQGSGANGAPIVIDRYGEGDRPAIHGNGVESVILLFNQEYWEINNLEITNLEPVGEGQTPSLKRGIHIAARDMGAVRHIHLKNLEVHDVNSEKESFDSRYYGGIFFQILGSNTPTWFDGILVEGCHVYDVDRTGISNDSSWWERGLNSSFGDVLENTGTGSDRTDRWVPSENVAVRDNLIEHIGGNGVIIRVARNALVENNRVFYAGEDISGNGMFCFNTDSTLFQYNEVAYTVYNPGDTDARGIDSDYRTKHTIIQYNYLHHNGYGGVVATGGPGGQTAVPRYNDGTIIRYNILVDNEDHIIRGSGNLTNMQVYNNVVYTSEEYAAGSTITVVVHDAWSGPSPHTTSYYNNIFLTRGAEPRYNLGNSRYNEFSNNLFWGEPPSGQPHDPNRVEADPMLVDPKTTDGWEGLDGFMVQAASPAAQNGQAVDGAPAEDFFGNPIPSSGQVDIGIHQATAAVGVEPEAPRAEAALTVYPNPVARRATVSLTAPHPGRANLALFDMLGREVASWEHGVRSGPVRFQIDLSAQGLAAGLYYLNAEVDGVPLQATSLIWTGDAP